MSLDVIKRSIVSDADAKAKAIESDASREAARIVADAEKKAGAVLRQAKEDAEKEAARLWKEAEAGIETERNTLIVAAQGEVVSKYMKEVRDEIAKSVESKDLERIFEAGMKEFRRISDSEEVVVISGKRNSDIAKGRNVKVETGDIDGFVFCTPDRKISLNATVSGAVEKNIDTIRRAVAEELFGGKGAASKRMPVRRAVKNGRKSKPKRR